MKTIISGLSSTSAHLREYPIRFGFKMTDLYDDLTGSGRGRAPFPIEIPSAIESFQGMPDGPGMFQYAKLSEVFNYLRRGKHMRIPDPWKFVVPKPE